MSTICSNCGCVIRENNSLCPACGKFTPPTPADFSNLNMSDYEFIVVNKDNYSY